VTVSDSIVTRHLEKEGLDADEHRQRLANEANEMLAEFLRKTRTLRRKGGGSRGLDSRKLDMVSQDSGSPLTGRSSTLP
jgi:hypothetical protein